MLRRPAPWWCAVLAVAGSVQAADPASSEELPPLIHQLTLLAGKFWGNAPYWYCRETLRQSGPDLKRIRHGLHLSEPPKTKPTIAKREIVSWYGFSALSTNPESIHEIRQIVSVDGKPEPGAPSAENFCRLLHARNDFDKQALVERFQQATLSDAPLDFGQLVMLFTHRAIDRYSFRPTGNERVGADPVVLFQYLQQAGSPGLHIDQNKAIPLAGTLSLRESDGAPLRITVVSSRRGKDKIEVRDEAEVEYQEVQRGVVLPASLVHRRLENGELRSDDRAVYAGWQAVPDPKPKAAQ